MAAQTTLKAQDSGPPPPPRTAQPEAQADEDRRQSPPPLLRSGRRKRKMHGVSSQSTQALTPQAGAQKTEVINTNLRPHCQSVKSCYFEKGILYC